MLKNYSRYYNHYSINFIVFMSIYDTINLNIFLFYMIFNHLYLKSMKSFTTKNIY